MIYRRKDGSWILVDYKTNRLTPERKRFLRHYGRQMELYAMALQNYLTLKSPYSVFYLAAEYRFYLIESFLFLSPHIKSYGGDPMGRKMKKCVNAFRNVIEKSIQFW